MELEEQDSLLDETPQEEQVSAEREPSEAEQQEETARLEALHRESRR